MSQQPPSSRFPQFPESYWIASEEIPAQPKLMEDIEADVTIVGAGLTGLTTAYLLAERGVRVVVLEAGRMVHGTTGHTTAKVTAQHSLFYDELISHFGEDKARLYYQANQEAVDFVKKLVNDHSIGCQLSEEDAYVYTQSDSYVEKLQKEAEAYRKLGIPGGYAERISLPYETKGAVGMKNQAQFNPVPFLKHLAGHIIRMGGRIYENTTVNGVSKEEMPKVKTSDGHQVTCRHVVVASHFPFNDRNGFYFSRLHAERSYVIAGKTKVPFPGGMYISAETPTRSLRSVRIDGEPMVIFGGEGHKTGQGICTFQYYEALEQFAREEFGLEEIAYRWSAQDLYTLDKVPYIGQMLKDQPNIYMATGYKKWGMSTSVAAAILNTRLITGEGSPYAELFSPQRFHADPDVKTFVAQNTNVAANLLAGKLDLNYRKPEELGSDEGGVVKIKGKRTGAYRDKQGQLHLVDTTCKHMGCEVNWNAAERTWDCPCHGSRYDHTGQVIEGPAKQALDPVKGE
ncbi:FAD-dependent oxidoreductase [Paenibacillus aurantius]|uniref:FAD-dependent oxidoreductase n=1 Tax=Paenibacillus aurantius TaxID=2918900 RepID=A0AA96LGV3_9BACL|nr:FAD-dependent oxidoreductase [Paenibacillus aurantius]WNQ13854.1 FAD-dependent oxidoreductase [Paenibacillus aurantius]